MSSRNTQRRNTLGYSDFLVSGFQSLMSRRPMNRSFRHEDSPASSPPAMDGQPPSPWSAMREKLPSLSRRDRPEISHSPRTSGSKPYSRRRPMSLILPVRSKTAAPSLVLHPSDDPPSRRNSISRFFHRASGDYHRVHSMPDVHKRLSFDSTILSCHRPTFPSIEDDPEVSPTELQYFNSPEVGSPLDPFFASPDAESYFSESVHEKRDSFLSLSGSSSSIDSAIISLPPSWDRPASVPFPLHDLDPPSPPRSFLDLPYDDDEEDANEILDEESSGNEGEHDLAASMDWREFHVEFFSED